MRQVPGNRRTNGHPEAGPVDPFRRSRIAFSMVDERPQSIDVEIEDPHWIPIHFDDDPNLGLRAFDGGVCSLSGLAGLANLGGLDH